MPEPTDPIDPTQPIEPPGDPAEPIDAAEPGGSMDPVDPVLDARLARLAPTVDVELATRSFADRRAAVDRRRRVIVGGGIAASVLVVLGVVAAVTRPADDGQTVLAGSTTEATDPAPTEPDVADGQIRTSSDQEGLSMAITTSREATVGERMWIEAALTNERTTAIQVASAGGCNEPLVAAAGSPETIRSVVAALEPVDLVAPGLVDQSLPWSGDPTTLASAFDAAQPPKLYRGRSEGAVRVNGVACADVVVGPTRIEPGETITRRIAIDLRWVDAGSAEGRTLDVLARPGAITDLQGQPIPPEVALAEPVHVIQSVTLRDPVDRAPSRDAAVASDGVVAAPTFGAWLELTGDLDGQAVQEYRASLTWWQGAWEAWITPEMGSGHQADALRIRFDPERNRVDDVRTVFWNLAPSDDPDQQPSIEPVDEIRYQAD